jgi:predicted nucleic acid-binding protein
MPVYLDTNVFIAAIEGDQSDVRSLLWRRLFAVGESRRGMLVTSELTLGEILPKVAAPVHRAYMDLIVRSGTFDLRSVSRQILVETAAYRKVSIKKGPDGRESMVKLPDAIHIVTAIHSQCHKILSDDTQLRLPEGYDRVACGSSAISGLLEEMQ